MIAIAGYILAHIHHVLVLRLVSPVLAFFVRLYSIDTFCYFHSMPNLLINRLVLNLRNYSTPLHRGIITEPNDLPDMMFQSRSNRVLGNIAAPLDHGQWKDTFGWVEEESDGGSGDPEEPFDGTTAGETTGSSLLTGSVSDLVPFLCRRALNSSF